MTDQWTPCGLGVCAAEDGHTGTCAEASGWDDRDEPHRVQLSRRKGWRKPENTVVVARPSKWGNPFRIEQVSCSLGGLCWAVSLGNMVILQHIDSQEKAREKAVYFFRSWMEEDDHHDLPDPAPLAGKNLACWCPPGSACHADVLLELANS